MPLLAHELLEDEQFLYIGRRILAGHCSLFVGAGASISSGGPLTSDLARLVCEQVLMTDEKLLLGEAVAYADSTAGRRAVVNAIRPRLEGLSPSPSVRAIPLYRWRSIYTTNFDDLIEQAYNSRSEESGPILEVFDSATDLDRSMGNRIPLYMLHGSIRHALGADIGLVLTSDDIRLAEARRTALYRKLTTDLLDGEIVYVGFSMIDEDFRKIVDDLWSSQNGVDAMVPRGYAFVPTVRAFEQRYWDGKKITLIGSTLEEFMSALATLASGRGAEQPIPIGIRPALPPFLSHITPSSDRGEDIVRAFSFPHFDEGEDNARGFFRGEAPTWGTIRSGLDAPRSITDRILERIIVSREDESVRRNERSCRFVMIDGAGGTGKTTLLRRISWEIAHTWGRPCVWSTNPSYIQLDLIEDLVRESRQRVYVFIDDCADSGIQLVSTIRRCKTRGIPVSFITSDRGNEWENATRYEPLDPDHRYTLERINEQEATEIVRRLERCGELGDLSQLDEDARKTRLLERSNGHLLVALREITEGRGFDDIVLDEYEGIPSRTAQVAYLLTCTLYQFNIPLRAGIMSRSTGISFLEIAEKILKPADGVIVGDQYDSADEPRYRARHGVIAGIIFRRAMLTSRERSNYIIGTLRQLDPGYREDRRAFHKLINYTWLRDRIVDSTDIEQIYVVARRLRPSDPFVIQQEGLSYRRSDPKMADALLSEASKLAPQSDIIKHSQITLLLDAAESAQGEERERLIARARVELERLTRVDPSNSASYVSLARLYLIVAESLNDPVGRIGALASAQTWMQQAFLNCRASVQMFEMLAKMEEAAGRLEMAEADYGRAARQVGARPAAWRTFGSFLGRRERWDDAVTVLNEGLDSHPADPGLSYDLARALELSGSQDDATIRRAYKSAVVEPGLGYMPSLDFAIYLYLSGDVSAARDVFRQLRSLDVPDSLRRRPRYWIPDGDDPRTFDAEVRFVGNSSSEVMVPDFDEPIFMSTRDLPPHFRRPRIRIQVHIFFNLLGPRAVMARQ